MSSRVPNLRAPALRAVAVWVALAAMAAAGLSAATAAAAAQDPGLLLELDLAGTRLTVTDLETGELGPAIRVVVGSPASPTPRGSYPLGRVILNPSWHPSEQARAAGAVEMPASLDTPMGVAKIPFAQNGSIALHGAGDPLLLGKPVSSGCVRASDADLLRILAWLHRHRALDRAAGCPDGELHRSFRRSARLIVR